MHGLREVFRLSDFFKENLVKTDQQIQFERPNYLLDYRDYYKLKFDRIASRKSSYFNGFNVDTPVKNFFAKYIKVDSTDKILHAISHNISLSSKTYLTNNNEKSLETVMDLDITNNCCYINRHFREVNAVLPVGGSYLGCVETNRQRNKRLYGHWNTYLASIIIFFEFIFHRVMPKISYLRKFYFFITKRKYRFISKAETLGRLVFCGFSIVNYKEINNITYFVANKSRVPNCNMSPNYGPIIKLRRIGKGGKIISVYKFRTMHPYSEYLQDYVLKHNGYNKLGKPANDFRLTPWGKVFRKFWLDEIPQLINVLKGEMNLVGIRPVSMRFLEEYPEDIKKKRMKLKPGCIPPYVALLKQDVKEYIESERIYIVEHEKHPYLTDLRYFIKAVYNITTNKIRSL